MRKLFLALVCVAAFSLPAYSNDKKTDKMQMTVASGEEVAIQLEANPTTGYSWIVNNLGGIEKLVLISDEYAEDDSVPEDFTGAPGKQIFTFKVADGAEGVEELHFSYLRVWEKGVTPIEDRIVEVTVK